MEQLAIEDQLCDVSKRLVQAIGRVYSLDASVETEFDSVARALAVETEALVAVVNNIASSAARKRKALGISDSENGVVRAMLTDFTETSACNLQQHIVHLIQSSKGSLSRPSSFVPQQEKHKSLEQAITDIQFISTSAFLLLNPEEVHRGSGATMRLLTSAASVCAEADALTRQYERSQASPRQAREAKKTLSPPRKEEEMPTVALQVSVKVFLRYSAPYCSSELQSELKDAVVALVRNAKRVLLRQERSSSALDQVKLELATLLQTLCLTAVRSARVHEKSVVDASSTDEGALAVEEAGGEAQVQQLEGDSAVQRALEHLNNQHQQNLLRSVVLLLGQEVPWFAEQWKEIPADEVQKLLSKLAPMLPQHSGKEADHWKVSAPAQSASPPLQASSGSSEDQSLGEKKPKAPQQLAVKQEDRRNKRKSLNVRLQREIQEAAKKTAMPVKKGTKASEPGEGEVKTSLAPRSPRRRSSSVRRPREDLRKTLVREPTVQALLSSDMVQQQRLRNAEDISRFATLKPAGSSFRSLEHIPSDKVVVSRPILVSKPSAMTDIMTLLSTFRNLAQQVYSVPFVGTKKCDVQQLVVAVHSAAACLSELMAMASQKRIGNSPPSWIDKVEVSSMKQCYLLLASVEKIQADDVLLANAESSNLPGMLAYLDGVEAQLKHKLRVVTVLVESFALPVHIGNYSQQAFYKLQCCLVKFGQLSRDLIRLGRTRNAFIEDLLASSCGGYDEDDLDLSDKEEEVWKEITRTRERELAKTDDQITLNELLVLLVAEEVTEQDDFVKMVLFTYPSMCSAAVLLEKLQELFHVPSKRSSTTAKRVQQGVLTFLSLWLKRQPEEFTPPMLKVLNVVAEEGEATDAASAAKRLHKRLKEFRAGQRAVAARQQLEKLSTSVRLVEPTVVFTSVDHTSLARMLTLVDFRHFAAITPSELLKLVWSKEKTRHLAPNVMAMIQRLNSVAQWVASMVVWPERVQERVANFEHFVKVASTLLELGSFNSLQAVLAALNMTAVQRLKHTRARVSDGAQAKFKELNMVLTSGHNWKAMRDAVAAAVPPVLPYLGLYLTDLTFTEDGNRDLIEGKVNLKKRRMVYGIMQSLLKFQAVPYSFEVEHPAFTLVSEVPALEEEQLYQCSLRREPRDVDSRTLAILEKGKP